MMFPLRLPIVATFLMVATLSNLHYIVEARSSSASIWWRFPHQATVDGSMYPLRTSFCLNSPLDMQQERMAVFVSPKNPFRFKHKVDALIVDMKGRVVVRPQQQTSNLMDDLPPLGSQLPTNLQSIRYQSTQTPLPRLPQSMESWLARGASGPLSPREVNFATSDKAWAHRLQSMSDPSTHCFRMIAWIPSGAVRDRKKYSVRIVKQRKWWPVGKTVAQSPRFLVYKTFRDALEQPEAWTQEVGAQQQQQQQPLLMPQHLSDNPHLRKVREEWEARQAGVPMTYAQCLRNLELWNEVKRICNFMEQRCQEMAHWLCDPSTQPSYPQSQPYPQPVEGDAMEQPSEWELLRTFRDDYRPHYDDDRDLRINGRA